MRVFLRIFSALALCFGVVNTAQAGDKAIIVLDASGSMWGQIGGKPKVAIARETLKTVLQTIPADLELGLMAYGHREKGSCTDIELIVPPAAGTASAISGAADALKFLGKTPLSAAVKEAAEALRYTEEKATVILITDGLETCDADPCALGKSLEETGIDFTAHVVGFGLTAEEGKKVACLAENTGGKYIQASDAGQLKDALVATVVEKPAPAPDPAPAPQPAAVDFNFQPDVIMAEGAPSLPKDAGNVWEIFKANSDGSRGELLATEYGNSYKGKMDPGDYFVEARLGLAKTEQKVTLTGDAVAKPIFVLNAGTLVITPVPSEGAEPSDSAAVVVEFPGGDGPSTNYGKTTVVVPAGEQKLTVRIGKGEVSDTVTVAAGQTIEKTLVAGIGRVVANASYIEGMKVEESGIKLEVVKAAKKIDGSRDSMTINYGPDATSDLPPGDYVLLASIGGASAEKPFSLKSGESLDADVVLNAGVLSIEAPGALKLELFGAKKDIQGKRKDFGSAYDQNLQTTLPVGDYVVVVTYTDDKASKESPTSVKAGERTELKVE
ncbi:VWA domain-containing protein [Mesorhizobium sp. NBSH29]|uniref:vWA domain-containing protein n=1 Tax=Mesorhizobium sp. NBSH29 TaxID=2654249 RepID=UPI0018967181|nr:VWA domain-containing protein [Mesorhizobium sp. NBSH29]QPC86791.1 VWA domain-containing protein [Mesorhizobium sp. NBSH29]